MLRRHTCVTRSPAVICHLQVIRIRACNWYYYTLYSLSAFLLAKNLQLILEISASYSNNKFVIC